MISLPSPYSSIILATLALLALLLTISLRLLPMTAKPSLWIGVTACALFVSAAFAILYSGELGEGALGFIAQVPLAVVVVVSGQETFRRITHRRVGR